MADWHIGQTVHVIKAGENEPYAGIVVSGIPGPGPTIVIFPKFAQDNYYDTTSSSVLILANVPEYSAGFGNGWEPIA